MITNIFTQCSNIPNIDNIPDSCKRYFKNCRSACFLPLKTIPSKLSNPRTTNQIHLPHASETTLTSNCPGTARLFLLYAHAA